MSRKIYIETYGCQMNLADTEIINGILKSEGYEFCDSIREADAIFMNTCAVRDHAEQRIYGRLRSFKHYRKSKPHLVIGILGCMSERLKQDFIGEQKLVDVVCGPDEYRKLPALLDGAFQGESGIRIQLSQEETYDDVEPMRTEGISAWIPIMRGCDKFCSYCVVPYTRGRERSRKLEIILNEVQKLVMQDFSEVTLLGQNVNSYWDGTHDFADALTAVAQIDPLLRVRFMTSHPMDMSDRLINSIAEHKNICSSIHLPVQSGSDRVLGLMNRKYTRQHYLRLVEKIRSTIPDACLTTDIITGFPTETEVDHDMTLDLIAQVRFDSAFTFKYSPRENTKAWEMRDDVPPEDKSRRLEEIIALQRRISLEINNATIGKIETILIEGPSKRSEAEWVGRTDSNKIVVVPYENFNTGDYLSVRLISATSATLFGTVLTEILEAEAA